jgi:hypothetical protein
MHLPTQYAWFEPVLIAAIVVFVVDVIGSVIAFSRRPVLNALVSAILSAVIFGALVYYGYGKWRYPLRLRQHLPHQPKVLASGTSVSRVSHGPQYAALSDESPPCLSAPAAWVT